MWENVSLFSKPSVVISQRFCCPGGLFTFAVVCAQSISRLTPQTVSVPTAKSFLFCSGRRLLYEPPGKVLGGFEVVKLRRKFSSVHILVVEPGISHGKDSAPA